MTPSSCLAKPYVDTVPVIDLGLYPNRFAVEYRIHRLRNFLQEADLALLSWAKEVFLVGSRLKAT